LLFLIESKWVFKLRLYKFIEVSKIIFSGIIAFISLVLIRKIFIFSSIGNFFLGIPFIFVIYLLVLYLVGALKQEDLIIFRILKEKIK